MKKKKEINYERKSTSHKLYYLDEFDESIMDLRKMANLLTELCDKYEKEDFTDLSIEVFGSYDYDYYITGRRVETDSEYYERLEQEKKELERQNRAEQTAIEKKMKKRQEQIAKEQALYEKLKEKYDTQKI